MGYIKLQFLSSMGITTIGLTGKPVIENIVLIAQTTAEKIPIQIIHRDFALTCAQNKRTNPIDSVTKGAELTEHLYNQTAVTIHIRLEGVLVFGNSCFVFSSWLFLGDKKLQGDLLRRPFVVLVFAPREFDLPIHLRGSIVINGVRL